MTPWLCAWLALAAPAPEVDRVAIATRLVADGLTERAAAVLDELPDAPEDQALAYHTLRGLVALRLGDPAGALASLDAALATGEAEPLLHVQRAQALHALQRHEEALAALDLAGDAASGLPGAWQLRARALSDLGRPDAAYTTLRDATSRFPDHLGLAEDTVLLLVDRGLTREALDAAARLAPLHAPVATWVAVGERLRRAGALAEAIPWLEDARLRFPAALEPRLALASACLDAGRPRCAGEVLAEAAVLDPRTLSEAAECFRRAGDLERALYLNGQVRDEVVKVRQRLGLLLEQQRFDQAAALDARLRRLGLLEDEDLAYALAYACFRAGDPARAEELLDGLSDPRVFQQAIALREAMARCAERGGCG